MRKLVSKILNRPELIKQPPVLIDIGASESIHHKWKRIAKYSVCLAFDADERDFNFAEHEEGKYKKLYVYNCIVSDKDKEESNFYLTQSPYCSSLLEPYDVKLKHHSFSELFEITSVVSKKTVSLNRILSELNITKVDWFKTDSQGIDLRLFKNMNEEIQKHIIIAELEPGIIEAYKNEDKLYQILDFFSEKNFWLSDMVIKGVPRIPYKVLNKYFNNRLIFKLANESIHIAPGWGEMTFFNDFEDDQLYPIREYLLGWVFATIENHHSFALVLANKGKKKFDDPVFDELERKSLSYLRMEILKLKFIPSLLAKIKKKIV